MSDNTQKTTETTQTDTTADTSSTPVADKKTRPLWKKMGTAVKAAKNTLKKVLIGGAIAVGVVALVIITPKPLLLGLARLALPLLVLGGIGFGAVSVARALQGNAAQKKAADKPEQKNTAPAPKKSPMHEPKPSASRTSDFNIQSTSDLSSNDNAQNKPAQPAQKNKAPKHGK